MAYPAYRPAYPGPAAAPHCCGAPMAHVKDAAAAAGAWRVLSRVYRCAICGSLAAAGWRWEPLGVAPRKAGAG